MVAENRRVLGKSGGEKLVASCGVEEAFSHSNPGKIKTLAILPSSIRVPEQARMVPGAPLKEAQLNCEEMEEASNNLAASASSSKEAAPARGHNFSSSSGCYHCINCCSGGLSWQQVDSLR